MALSRQVFSLMFLCFHVLLHTWTSDAAGSWVLQDLNCSTSGNYSSTSAYAANINQFLSALPENAVSKNGGFFNGTVGEGLDTVYGLAMCPADYSRADCSDCLAAAAGSDADGLPSRCPGSTTVIAMFERCLIRYSNVSFLGTPEIGVAYAIDGKLLNTAAGMFAPTVEQNLNDRTDDAILVPQRFASNSRAPFVLVQCTWDLPPDKCKECLNELTKIVTDITVIKTDGQRKSYSCTVRYSNTSFMVVPFTAPASAPPPRSVDVPTDLPSPASSSSSSRSRGLIIGGVALLALLVLVLIWSVLSWCMLTRTRDSFGSETRLKPVEYRDLSIATNGFSKENKIGQGGFGVVYRGVLKEKPVAVKRILKDSNGEFKDFLAELGAIDGTGHLNVVRLEGWCCSINNFMFWWLHRQNLKLFLVYELVSNGSLQEHLHEKTEVLPWATRYKIVLGIGSALCYLHHECKSYILHRDIKPANILLDDEFNAKLGDFGLSRVAHNNVATSVQTMAVGTMGYMDPQCMKNGQVNFRTSSDVYSFGIVLLEIAHGENNPDHVRQLQKDKPVKTFVMEAADKKLAGKFDETQMERIILLGLQCSQHEEDKRPSLIGAMKFLENGGELRPATPDERHDTAHLVTLS
ncbi:cysteine-rich receptor-like protein kinase 25 [Lolium rigidum]|uniref:cysteine-rich receptor-like protein kinase 25 n=1 Tax=Lolium rigidum TaxID=89674 RepID=UPI001F5DE8D2|nr:cysteine-rich receptor-like protein kinase 25 [Lolium rigidum]